MRLSVFDQENTSKDSLSKIKTSLYEMNNLLGEDKDLEGKFSNIVELKKSIRDFNVFIDSFDFFLGNQKEVKHLVIFQSPANLAVTGGK